MTATRKSKTPAQPVKEPGLFQKFSAYVAKNQAANKKAGDPSLSDEFSKFGADWGKNLSRGMAEVGNAEEAKLLGKSKKATTGTFNDTDDTANEMLFGSKKPAQGTSRGSQNESLVDDGELRFTLLCDGKMIIQRSSGAGIALDEFEQKRVYTFLKKIVG